MTTTVFTPQTVALNLQIFEVARSMVVLDDATIDRLRRQWFHQFILAGTWRALKGHDTKAARQVYALFHLPEIRAQGISLRWLAVRAAFAVLSGALVRWLCRSTAMSRDGAVNAAATQLKAGSTGRHQRGAEIAREW